MILFVKLIFAHLIGDFVFQPRSWVKEKEVKKATSIKLYLHVLIHGALVFLFVWDWKLALIIAGSHLIIDLIKLYFQNHKTNTIWFVVDQLLHLLVILVLGALWLEMGVPAFWQDPQIWLYATAILFITIVGGIIIQVLMSNWSKNLLDGENESLSNAGKYIGILERLFVFIFVITGHWEAVGFLLTAKSVFRFGDLKESKDRKLTEYILIGTLLSFGLAILTALLVLSFS